MRDFWRSWRREHRRRWHDDEERAEAWRSFFREFMGTLPEEHWAFGGRPFNPWHHGMDAFNPFVAKLLTKGGGLLPLYVMHLLAEKPRYGNEIMEIIGERTRGQWISNPGAIYPLMTMLEERGYIRGEWEDPTKRTIRVYHLTEEGEREMNRLKAVVKPKLLEAVEVLQDLAADLNDEQPPTEYV